MITMKELASLVAQIEGKKVETSIGNIREILAILSDLIHDHTDVMKLLFKNGNRRAKIKATKALKAKCKKKSK